MADINESVKEAVKKGRAVIGTRSVLKGAKRGEIGLVVCASNTPESLKGDLEHYARASGIEVKGFKGDSAKLGGLCGRPFNILVMGIRK